MGNITNLKLKKIYPWSPTRLQFGSPHVYVWYIRMILSFFCPSNLQKRFLCKMIVWYHVADFFSLQHVPLSFTSPDIFSLLFTTIFNATQWNIKIHFYPCLMFRIFARPFYKMWNLIFQLGFDWWWHDCHLRSLSSALIHFISHTINHVSAKGTNTITFGVEMTKGK